MQLHRRRFLSLLLAVCLALALPVPALTAEARAADGVSYEKVLASSLSYIFSRVPEPVFGAEWSVLALARAEYPAPDYYGGYFDRIAAHVRQNESARLDRSRVTENARLILALSSLGIDAADVGGYDLLAPTADFSFVTRQGISGPVFTLLALDANAYEIPTDAAAADPATREKMIDYILGRESKKGTKEAGGFALAGDDPDPDVTGMVLQALAPYGNRPPVAAAIDRALAVLSRLQSDDGGFFSWGAANAESVSQVIMALTALGIDPTADLRFVKKNGDPVTALLRFAVSGGGFEHVPAGGVSGMATDQGTHALVAYDRFRKGKNGLYDMRDAFGSSGLPSGGGGEDPVPFDDVTTAHWFYEAVRHMQSTGLMRGVSAKKFAPDTPLTRAMLVTILHRREHEPPAAAGAAFSDTANGAWYTAAVTWAGAGALVSGYGDGRFGPNDNVTREQAAVILYNYGKWKGLDMSASADLTDYTDAGNISDWALPAVRWAVAGELLTGRTAKTLVPRGTATRAEVAALLTRLFTSDNQNVNDPARR